MGRDFNFGYTFEKVICEDNDELCSDDSNCPADYYIEHGDIPFYISRSCDYIKQKHNLTISDIDYICEKLISNYDIDDIDYKDVWINIKSIDFLKELPDIDISSIFNTKIMAYLTYRYVLAKFPIDKTYAHIHYS